MCSSSFHVEQAIYIQGIVINEDGILLQERSLEHLQPLCTLDSRTGDKERYLDLGESLTTEKSTVKSNFAGFAKAHDGDFIMASYLDALSDSMVRLKTGGDTDKAAIDTSGEVTTKTGERPRETTAVTAPKPAPDTQITTSSVHAWLQQKHQGPNRYSQQSHHFIFDLKNGIRHGLATAPPAIELSGGTSSDKVLVFGGMDASIWNGNFKTLGVFYYYRQNNRPRLPPYILLLNKDAISRDGADPAEVFAASVKSTHIACTNQFPELKTDKYKSEFGWLR
jgi:hypothetical protein